MAVKPIQRSRFEALAGYTRQPALLLFVQEYEWLTTSDERVLGILTWDRHDYDFGWIALGRDERLQFRAIGMDASLPSADAARAALSKAMEVFAAKPDEAFFQDDTGEPPVDFFKPLSPPEKLHPTFKMLVDDGRYSPARGLIAEMMRFHSDADGNFVEQFQTTAFDARLWELYLFAAFNELGFARDAKVDVPDFMLASLRGLLGVEATSANPPQGDPVPFPKADDEFTAYLKNYVPIKLARALKPKLKKKTSYWSLPHMKDVPFVIGVQDFHGPGAMTMIVPAATEYVFGVRHSVVAGRRKFEWIDEHRFGAAREKSGFFRLPGGENVSAVIVNPQGTLTKFNRMGFLAGFGNRDVQMVRRGVQRNEGRGDGQPTAFVHRVSDPGYEETWVEGMVVLHNPGALIPLDPDLIPGANHEFLRADGGIMSLIPDFHPYYSQTFLTLPGADEPAHDSTTPEI